MNSQPQVVGSCLLRVNHMKEEIFTPNATAERGGVRKTNSKRNLPIKYPKARIKVSDFNFFSDLIEWVTVWANMVGKHYFLKFLLNRPTLYWNSQLDVCFICCVCVCECLQSVICKERDTWDTLIQVLSTSSNTETPRYPIPKKKHFFF